MSTEVFWISPVPVKCDTCETQLTNTFYDAKTEMGPWACMCPSCQNLGPGLGKVGPNKGQKYEKQADGRFKKTDG